MTEKHLKIIFGLLAAMILAAMLWISREAGISGDEEVHYRHSEMVYSYFKTMGKDQSSLHTPKTHLQYYGQAYDNLVTMLIHWFNIDDIYSFRHLMSSIAGWLTILITALFAVHFSGYGAGIIVLILFSASPTFLGHSQNNLKDIPFALAYIASTFFAIKLIFDNQKPPKKVIFLLILSIALSIGIRAGGLLVLFYFGLFLLVKILQIVLREKKFSYSSFRNYILLFSGVSLAGYLLGLITWPYALQNPVLNVWKSYQVMTHFPTTVRQIFDGQFAWSDFHPWYYLPKYMIITIPLVIFAGLAAFAVIVRKTFTNEQKIKLALIGFTIVFPLAFVVLKGSNLYGSWRHFLFVYPGLILLSALGFHAIFSRFSNKVAKVGAAAIIAFLLINPVRFMANNHPYYYLYYNELVGGLKGAYGKYETDYYYHTMRAGSQWLLEYLKNKPENKEIIVGSNFPVQWFFRANSKFKTVYFPYQNRSQYNWHYAIIANSYIPPEMLTKDAWPPANTIHTIRVDGVPVCAVIERVTTDDLQAINYLKDGDYIKSALLFEKATAIDPQNELICYKFAESLIGLEKPEEADRQLTKCLDINRGYDPALILKGDLALKIGQKDEATRLYEMALKANRKNFGAYTKLAALYAQTNVVKARSLLVECLRINPRYKPALQGLADLYRETNPEIANKYDKLINKLK